MRPTLLISMLALLGATLQAEVSPLRRGPLPLEPSKTKTGVLPAFASVAEIARPSVVELEVDGKRVSLATAIDAGGLVLTKASEISNGKLTARLATGQAVDAQLLSIDADSDVALVRVKTSNLKPIKWAAGPVTLGQWAISPGINAFPEAAGVVSAAPRRILPKRAIIGVYPDSEASNARIRQVMPGLSADQAGLRAGDVILKVDSQTVTNAQQLVATLRQYREGQKIKLRVQREDHEFDAELEMVIAKPERLDRVSWRQERMNRLGSELSRRAEGFALAIQHDSALQPWQCGGPLVNSDGEALGLNIARAGRIASYALPGELVQRLIIGLSQHAALPVNQESPMQ